MRSTKQLRYFGTREQKAAAPPPIDDAPTFQTSPLVCSGRDLRPGPVIEPILKVTMNLSFFYGEVAACCGSAQITLVQVTRRLEKRMVHILFMTLLLLLREELLISPSKYSNILNTTITWTELVTKPFQRYSIKKYTSVVLDQ